MKQRLISLAGIIGFLVLLFGAGYFLYLAFLDSRSQNVSDARVLAPEYGAEFPEEE